MVGFFVSNDDGNDTLTSSNAIPDPVPQGFNLFFKGI
jgi:hypothetical protein